MDGFTATASRHARPLAIDEICEGWGKPALKRVRAATPLVRDGCAPHNASRSLGPTLNNDLKRRLVDAGDVGLLHQSAGPASLVFFEVESAAQITIQASPFSHEIILCAVRWYLRFSPSYQDTADLLSERGISVGRSTVC